MECVLEDGEVEQRRGTGEIEQKSVFLFSLSLYREKSCFYTERLSKGACSTSGLSLASKSKPQRKKKKKKKL